MHTFLQDLRYGLRMLCRSPGFTVVAVLTLALGIGANTAIFSVINAVLLKSLPVSHPEELVMLTQSSGGLKLPSVLSQALWEQIRDHQDVFAGVCAYGSTGSGDLSTGGAARPVSIGLVTGGFFSTLGVRTIIGRPLMDADDQPGGPQVAVITYAFWQSEYGGSGDVVGRSVTINGHPFQIVGVTEPSFFGVEYGYYAPVWVPQSAGTIIRGAGAYSGGGWVIGRLKPGVTLEQSRARMATLAPAIYEATVPPDLSPEAATQYRKTALDVLPFSQGLPFIRERYGEALLILMAIVGVVLLIACANVANLLLARATVRQREIAVRLALGAGRFRLIRQLLTESVLLSLLGAGLSVLFAAWGSHVLVGFMANTVFLELAPDMRVFGFTLALGVLTGVLFGLAPAWRAVRVDPHAVMKPGGRGVAEGHSRFNTGKVLVVAQIALSLVMITGAGLLLGSWLRLVTLDPGFRSEGVLLAGVNIRAAQIPDDRQGATYSRILERLRALPGVAVASAAARTPIGRNNWNTVIDVEGFVPSSGNNTRVQLNQVSEGYFATIGTPMLAGRDFNRGDVLGSPEVAIVNEELARRFFGGAGALGQRFRVPSGTGLSSPIEIVGIAANTKELDLREPNKPIVYFALSQETRPGSAFTFALRTEGSPSALIPGVKAALAGIDPRFSLTLHTLQEQVDESVRLPRTLAMLSGFFGALALLLAALGLYGIIAYSVARRQNEIGVRIALGATGTRVIRMVLGDVGRIVFAGVALGVLLSLAVTQLVSTFLYGVEPNDPATLALSALLLVCVAFGAAMMPARRAMRVDPMVALRYE